MTDQSYDGFISPWKAKEGAKTCIPVSPSFDV